MNEFVAIVFLGAVVLALWWGFVFVYGLFLKAPKDDEDNRWRR